MSAAADPKTTPAPSAQSAPSASPVDAHSSPVAETRERSGKATAIGFGRQAKTETATGRKSGRGQAQAGFVLGSSPSSERSITMIVTAAIIAS